MPKREKALAQIEIAGATNDQTAFLRIYSENRIQYPDALAAFRKGLAVGARAGLWK